MNKLVFASVISEIQQSDIFMTVKARICEAPAANLNGARVTEAFIDEIVGNADRYVGLPLYADVRALTNGNYRRLGHLYDSKTGEFHSTQIGSFYQFEKEEFDGGCYLVGYARIAKRNKKLSKAISELFADGALKFSFEVAVGEYEELDDDTILIDASESNYLEGTAIVTFPACEDAVALELVAQADDNKGGEKDMKQKLNEVAEATVVAEATETAEAVETADATKAVENAEATETANENAAVVVHETDDMTHTTYAYDTESGVDVMQRVEVTTSVSHVEPDAQIVETDDGIHIAEEDATENEETVETAEEVATEETPETTIAEEVSETTAEDNAEVVAEETSEETVIAEDDPPAGDPPAEENPESATADDVAPVAEEPKRKTAEQLIEELTAAVESLKQEIAEMKTSHVVAETITAEVNPLMDDIHTSAKYSLLEKEDRISSYSLLSK